MEVKFLKAGSGDSIIIHHNSYNFIIDGGNDSQYLISEVIQLQSKGHHIDLLVITHHDDDHIKGILNLLNYIIENNHTDLIKQVIFNSPRKVLGKIEDKNSSNTLSYKQAYEVEELLLKINTKWESYTNNSDPLIFDDLTIDVICPTAEVLKEYGDGQKGEYLTGDYKCDWNCSLSKLDKHIDDRSKDRSLPNKTSIVMHLKTENQNILLTGDVTPDRLESIIDDLYRKNDETPVFFDAIKLPHHGSYRSLTKSIVEKLRSDAYIISTNSNKHYLPNKRALLKILKYTNRKGNQQINFVFNYEETIENLDIHKKELQEYNFKLTPNNKNYGISIGKA